MNRKGQWAHAMARDQRSLERRERLNITKSLVLQGKSAEEIALALNVSGNTVRQYIKEVQPIIQIERRLAALEKKSEIISQELDSLNVNGSSDPKKIEAWIEKGIQFVNVNAERVGLFDSLGHDTNAVRDSIVEALRSFYTSLYSTVIVSLHSTFNSGANQGKISDKELAIWNDFFPKWNERAEKHLISKQDYAQFKTEVQALDVPEKISNIAKILTRIEEKILLEKHIAKLDNTVARVGDSLEIDAEEMRRRVEAKSSQIGSAVKAGPIIVNIFVPGLGTLIWGGTSKRVHGIIQLSIALLGVVIPTVGMLLVVGAWIWALYDAIQIASTM